MLLIAKKKSALQELNRQFEARSVEKIYLAMVENPPAESSGMLAHWVGKDQKEKRAMVQPANSPGAFLCQLDYQVQKTLPNGHTLLEVRPHTGKFHQIRIQLATMGCPIVGDEKYGATSAFVPNGIALHAWKLSFTDPLSGERLWVEAPSPIIVTRSH
ncbi:MAG: RNA pseudouridine synthase [Saprospirales bacterium]|nr:RNA pseudouridine synthase [Saprospirales bacterium]